MYQGERHSKHYNDDFDVDDGIDLQQFEYGERGGISRPTTRQTNTIYDEDNPYVDNGVYVSDLELNNYTEFEEHDYNRYQPYVTEFDDNVFLQSHPFYDNDDNLATLRSKRTYKSRKPSPSPPPPSIQHRYDRQELVRQTSYLTSKSSRLPPGDTYRSRVSTPAHGSVRSYAQTPRTTLDRRTQHDSNFDDQTKYKQTKDWLRRDEGKNTFKKAKREKTRRFPPPDPKAPIIPLPDYEGSATALQYVPTPDY